MANGKGNALTHSVFEFGRLETPTLLGLLPLVGLVFVLAWVVWLYRRDAATLAQGTRRLLLGLRLALWGMVALFYLEPRVRSEQIVERPSRVLIAVDTSLSMSLPAEEQTTGEPPLTRLAQVTKWIESANLLERLGETHTLDIYSIGESAKRQPVEVDSPDVEGGRVSELLPTEAGARESRLGDGLATALQEHRGRPLAAVFFFSDGRNNAGSGIDVPVALANAGEVPIYTVGVGSETAPPNVRVAELRVPTRAFIGDEVRGQALVRASGLAGEEVQVEILVRSARGEESPELVEVQSIVLPDDNTPVAVDFTHLPEETGAWEIVAQVATMEGEIRGDDNRAVGSLDVVDQKTRVLVLAGGPTREYRFLRNLLYRDDTIEVAVYLQSGGAAAAQEADRPLKTLPDTRGELFRYDTIVAVDPDWSRLDTEVASLLEEWVARQSGGLILVAGPVHTPRLARQQQESRALDLYPVDLKEVFTSDFEAGRFREPWPVEFTRDGDVARYLNLADDDEQSRELWEAFPGVYWCYPVAGLKPAATVLAHFGDPRAGYGTERRPLIVRQFYGSGRVLYLGTGELWRLRRLGQDVYDRLWVRLVREMSQGRLLRGSSRAAVLLDSERVAIGTTMSLRAQVFGEDYRPLAAKVLPMSVIDPNGNVEQHELSRPEEGAGLYETSLVFSIPGEYRLQLLAPGTSEIVERRVVAEIPQREWEDVRQHRVLLESLAEQTGGRYLAPEELETLADSIEDRTETTIVSREPVPLWDNVWMLLLVVGLAGTEWLVRKRHYLA